MNKNFLVALLTVSVITAAGCGGDDEKKSGGGSSPAPAPAAPAASAPATQDMGAASAAQELIDSVNNRYEEELAASNAYGIGSHSKQEQQDFIDSNPESFRIDGGCVLSADLDALMEAREISGKKVSFVNSIKEYCKVKEVSKPDCAKAVRLAQSISTLTKKIEDVCAKNEKNPKSNYQAFGLKAESVKLVQTMVLIRDALEGRTSDEVSNYSGSINEDKPKTASTPKKADPKAISKELPATILARATALSEDIVAMVSNVNLEKQFENQVAYKDGKGFSRDEFRKMDPTNFRFDGGCSLLDEVSKASSMEVDGVKIDLVKSTVAACEVKKLSDSNCEKAVRLAEKIISGSKSIAGACAKSNKTWGGKDSSISLARALLDYAKLF